MFLPIIGIVQAIIGPALAVSSIGASVAGVVRTVDAGLQYLYGIGLHQQFFTLTQHQADGIGVDQLEWSVAWNDTQIGRFERLFANLQFGFVIPADSAEMKALLEEGEKAFKKYYDADGQASGGGSEG